MKVIGSNLDERRGKFTKRLSLVCLIIVMLFSIWDIATSSASELNTQRQDKFSLLVEELQNELKVTIIGKELQDVYAFELQLGFDPLRLQLQRADTEISGFTVQPVIRGDQIIMAHTKVGSAAGVSGEAVKLAEFSFLRIRGGDTQIELNEVQLVSSQLERVTIDIQKAHSFKDNRLRTQFLDIDKHWAEGKIRTAVELGFVSGYPDGTFRPNQHITRAEFSVLLASALQLPTTTELSFSDQQHIPSWAISSVAAAAQAGYMKGYKDQSFRSSQFINRAELTVIISRGLGKPSKSVGRASTLKFVDQLDIPQWAQSSVQQAVEQGILQGRARNQFAPLAQATRAEAVSLLINLLHYKAGLNVQ